LEPYTNQPLDKSSYLKKIQFTPKQTFLNIYETDEFLISVENKVTEIWQSKYKDDNGTPVYHVISEGMLGARQKNDENKQKLTTV